MSRYGGPDDRTFLGSDPDRTKYASGVQRASYSYEQPSGLLQPGFTKHRTPVSTTPHSAGYRTVISPPVTRGDLPRVSSNVALLSSEPPRMQPVSQRSTSLNDGPIYPPAPSEFVGRSRHHGTSSSGPARTVGAHSSSAPPLSSKRDHAEYRDYPSTRREPADYREYSTSGKRESADRDYYHTVKREAADVYREYSSAKREIEHREVVPAPADSSRSTRQAVSGSLIPTSRHPLPALRGQQSSESNVFVGVQASAGRPPHAFIRSGPPDELSSDVDSDSDRERRSHRIVPKQSSGGGLLGGRQGPSVTSAAGGHTRRATTGTDASTSIASMVSSPADDAADTHRSHHKTSPLKGGGTGGQRGVRDGLADERGAFASKMARLRLPPPDGKVRGLVGLHNLGNTCFMASCLQCLSNVTPLTVYMFKRSYQSELNPKSSTRGRMVSAYGELIQRMWREGSSASAERPSEVKAIVGKVASRFLGYDQQDAQEFLRFLLDAIHEDTNRVLSPPPYEELKESQTDSNLKLSLMWWKNYSARNNSFIKDLFCGQLRTSVRCNRCGFTSRCFDPFWDLSIPIPKGGQLRGSCTIQECLSAFVTPERLSGTECWYCSKCKRATDAEKVMHIFRCPVVLVIHLKRFSFSSFRRTKLTTAVKAPLRGFSLDDYIHEDSPDKGDESITYNLVGVSNHSGGLGGGHYTADCVNADDGRWHNFNDSRVSSARTDGYDESAAYLLFFQRA